MVTSVRVLVCSSLEVSVFPEVLDVVPVVGGPFDVRVVSGLELWVTIIDVCPVLVEVIFVEIAEVI